MPQPVTPHLPCVTAHGKFLRVDGDPWLLKGISYGPFAGTDGLPPPEQVERDLTLITQLGCNTLRLYKLPPRWFLDACSRAGLRVLIGWPWPMNTDFLRDRAQARAILEEVRVVARGVSGHPAVLGCVVGNEVPADLVRWMQPARVQRFLERMIEAGRRHAPGILWSYSTFPTTECLFPRNADFALCNIYLEERAAFARYLARLQHLAGDKPLVVGEFGLDSRRHGETRQAETLGWAWGAALRAGLAGQVVFSFTDDWFNDGIAMDQEWAFGVTTAARQPKEAYYTLQGFLPAWRRPGQGLRPHRQPRFSIIICSYNGARFLPRALESVQNLPYPDYEVILVDDGSTDPSIARLAAEFRDVRYFRLAHGGLSRARNFGARQASGSILVYLDDDAAADVDWLKYLALAFEDERVGAAGGPNIPPRATTWKRAALAACPGGPAVVMLNDSDAEHVPGCNLAVARAAWQEVGGFDPRHETAGDDVDFCWRLLEHGYRIAYHPGAMVWHERRRTIRAYLRQQIGYGRAEGALIAQHPHRFDRLGGARWRGRIYEPFAPRVNPPLIYGGVWGTAPYQFLYIRPPGGYAAIFFSLPWLALAVAFFIGAWWHPACAGLGVLLFLPAVTSAVRRAAFVPLSPGPAPAMVSRCAARMLVALLSLLQPVARGAARSLTCLKLRAWPSGRMRLRPAISLPRGWRRKPVAELAYWHEDSRDRSDLLAGLVDESAASGLPILAGGEWSDWDLDFKWSPWWAVRMVTATEFHGARGRLTRVRLSTHARPATLIAVLAMAALLPGLVAMGPRTGLSALAASFVFWLVLEHRHGAAATRALRYIQATAKAFAWFPCPERSGKSVGGKQAGGYNVMTPDRANPSSP